MQSYISKEEFNKTISTISTIVFGLVSIIFLISALVKKDLTGGEISVYFNKESNIIIIDVLCCIGSGLYSFITLTDMNPASQLELVDTIFFPILMSILFQFDDLVFIASMCALYTILYLCNIMREAPSIVHVINIRRIVYLSYFAYWSVFLSRTPRREHLSVAPLFLYDSYIVYKGEKHKEFDYLHRFLVRFIIIIALFFPVLK